MAEKAILCLGDSLTWGSVPAERDGPTGRYPRKARWTGVMVDRLGEDYVVIEEGLSARTTNIDDPADPRLNGAAYLPATLASHLPLDLVIIMLGTNDTKAYFSRTPLDIAAGMSVLAGQVLSATSGVGCAFLRPQVLLVAPPQLRPMPDPWFQMMFEGGHEKSTQLADAYRALASFMKIHFFDAASVIRTDGSDGIHFTEQNNSDLGNALADQVHKTAGLQPPMPLRRESPIRPSLRVTPLTPDTLLRKRSLGQVATWLFRLL